MRGADGTLRAFPGFGDGIVGAPVWPSDLVGQMDTMGALGLGLLSVVFTFFFVDFFDATGTLTGLAQRSGYLDERGDMPRAKTVFSMDGLACMFGAFMGTSTTTAYVESASGIEEGGRTGLTATVTGLLVGLALLHEGVPGFLTILVMPLTFSIANGVSMGVISYCAITTLTGKAREVNWVLYVVAALLLARYVWLGE